MGRSGIITKGGSDKQNPHKQNSDKWNPAQTGLTTFVVLSNRPSDKWNPHWDRPRQTNGILTNRLATNGIITNRPSDKWNHHKQA